MRYLMILGLLFFYSCNSEEKEVLAEKSTIKTTNQTRIAYAEGFSIKHFDDYKIITLKDAWKKESKSYQYVLYKNEKPKNIGGAIFIKIPINTIACMSLTHVAFLEKLGLENTIIALSGCDYVSSDKIITQISNNSIKEIGNNQNLNYEMLVEENPSFIMGYGIDASSNNYMNKLNDLGLKVVLNAEYMETHPLGKAEWIKFVAAFYDEDEKANKIFSKIEYEYVMLLDITKNITQKPTVFTGMPWNGSWYIPGRSSFQVQLFVDAGAAFLWMDNNERGSLVKSKEIILDEAYEADFWINQNSYNNIASIVGFDEKFSGFKAVKEKQLFNNNKRVNDKSGNDYWESGVVNPQIVLKDLIKIFHPTQIEHELYYYKKLE